MRCAPASHRCAEAAAADLIATVAMRYRIHDVTTEEPKIEATSRQIYESGRLSGPRRGRAEGEGGRREVPPSPRRSESQAVAAVARARRPPTAAARAGRAAASSGAGRLRST